LDRSVGLNSPRSLEACKRIGIKPNDLMHMDIEIYRNSSQDLKHLPKEVLELRYSYVEKLRGENINLCREERRRMIEDGFVVPIKRKSELNSRSNSPRNVTDNKSVEASGELERIKQKQVFKY
jgi:hypothetical protein